MSRRGGSAGAGCGGTKNKAVVAGAVAVRSGPEYDAAADCIAVWKRPGVAPVIWAVVLAAMQPAM